MRDINNDIFEKVLMLGEYSVKSRGIIRDEKIDMK